MPMCRAPRDSQADGKCSRMGRRRILFSQYVDRMQRLLEAMATECARYLLRCRLSHTKYLLIPILFLLLALSLLAVSQYYSGVIEQSGIHTTLGLVCL